MWPEEEADIRSWDCTSVSHRAVDITNELGYKEEERQTSKTKQDGGLGKAGELKVKYYALIRKEHK